MAIQKLRRGLVVCVSLVAAKDNVPFASRASTRTGNLLDAGLELNLAKKKVDYVFFLLFFVSF